MTPATDDHIAEIQARDMGLSMDDKEALFARVAADAETIKARENRIVSAQKVIRDQAEEIEAKEQEIRRLMFEKTPLLLALDIANQELAEAREGIEATRLEGAIGAGCLSSAEWCGEPTLTTTDDGEGLAAELATLREQVRVLRGALIRLSCHPCRYTTGAWVRCKGKYPAKMCDMCAASTALAATEPKG